MTTFRGIITLDDRGYRLKCDNGLSYNLEGASRTIDFMQYVTSGEKVDVYGIIDNEIGAIAVTDVKPVS